MDSLVKDVFGVLISYLPEEVSFLTVRRVCRYWHDMVEHFLRHVDLSRAHFSLSTDAAVWVAILRLSHLRRLRISPTYRTTEIGVLSVLNFASSMNEAETESQREIVLQAAIASGFPIANSLLQKVSQHGVLASLVHLELNMAPAARLTGLTSLRTLIIEPPVPVSFNTYKSIRRTPLHISELHLPPTLLELRILDSVFGGLLGGITQQCPHLKLLDLSESEFALSDQLLALAGLETLILNRVELSYLSGRKVPLPASVRNVQAIGFYYHKYEFDFSRCSSLTELNISFDLDKWNFFFGSAAQASSRVPKLDYSHLQSLQILKICNCHLTDAQLQLAVVSLTNLRALHVKKISAACLTTLQNAFPALKIVFEQPKTIDFSIGSISPHQHVIGRQICAECFELIRTCCIEDHALVCSALIRPCIFSQAGCPSRFNTVDLATHIGVCPFNVVICPRCQDTMKRSDFENHSRLHDKTGLLVRSCCPLTSFGCSATWSVDSSHVSKCEHWNAVCLSCEQTLSSSSDMASHMCQPTADRHERFRLPERTEAAISRFGRPKYTYIGNEDEAYE
eukprot:TRINITY_DN10566_c0_g1_i1.p1 TRINITY_DN10566_c0_g1~~TRINITY_DN10566_c0_g1_i1.p1  ORF type:complete len:567 (-),score=46.96 TRINITY_DN10566_c0_g1_i1:37-1737(-)